MISYLLMVNAWSLAGSILNKTFNKDYPLMDKSKGRWNEDITITSIESDEYDIPHSDAYYDYTRNDPNAKNPFTNPKDRARADYVVSGGNTASDDDELDYEVDGWDTDDDLMATIDDQYAHHFTNANSSYNDGWTRQYHQEKLDKMDYEPKKVHFYKYHEEKILKDIEEYVSGTYKGHYTGNSHEYRNVQTLDLMASKDLASGFCQANILKYGSRYGNKDGKNKKDLMKVIHYAMLLLHFDGHYGEPSMPSGNFEQMP